MGIGLCEYLSAQYFEPRDTTLVIGSLGASATLVYGVIKSPFSQPRNLIGGHIVSGLVGVACYHLFGDTLWLASGLAVAFAMVAMMATKTLHPPGGATALIAVIGGPKIMRSASFMRLSRPDWGLHPCRHCPADQQPLTKQKISGVLVLILRRKPPSPRMIFEAEVLAL